MLCCESNPPGPCTGSDQPPFLRSFKRFAARRGVPDQIVSDNGKMFKAAARALRGVKWIFNVHEAPWWGGVFERLVMCVKQCLRKTVRQAKLSADELLTVLLEVEVVSNSRPLTVVSTEDVEEPLTPSHFIDGRRIMSDVVPYPDGDDPPPSTSEDLTGRVRYLKLTVDQFGQRWKRGYLAVLREMHSHYRKVSHNSRVAVRDVVVIHSDNLAEVNGS